MNGAGDCGELDIARHGNDPFVDEFPGVAADDLTAQQLSLGIEKNLDLAQSLPLSKGAVIIHEKFLEDLIINSLPSVRVSR